MFASIPECYMEYRKIKIEAQSLFADLCQFNCCKCFGGGLDDEVVYQ